MKITLPLTLLLISSSVAIAANNPAVKKDLREYDVELIIYEDAHARYLGSELWPENEQPETADAIDEKIPVTEDKTIIQDITKLDQLSLSEIENIDKVKTVVDDDARFSDIEPAILIKEYEKINKSSQYNILYYAAWRQAGLDKTKTFSININELHNNHETTGLPPHENQQQHQQHQQQNQTEMNEQMAAKNHIDGSVRILLTRYLHFYSELIYKRVMKIEPENKLPGAGNNTKVNQTGQTISASGTASSIKSEPAVSYQNYPITAHRRMRSKELHYIDHPLVGMLIQINPAAKAKEAAQ